MARDALPCIACDKKLINAFSDADNQPEDGVAFYSNGHYGSTVFDPMDMSIIEVNVCDDCLREAAKKQQVLAGRHTIPVFTEGNFFVGTMRATESPYVPWEPGLPSDDKSLFVEIEELGNTELFPEVRWETKQVEYAKKHADDLRF